MTETKLLNIQIRNSAGNVIPLQVQEIISIDGQPYQTQENFDSLEAHVIQSEARITSIEQIVNSLVGSLAGLVEFHHNLQNPIPSPEEMTITCQE